jgi:uncharacterized protein YecE (DUF72 family)
MMPVVMVRIGCSGWNYRHWRDPVYGGAPAGSWLERYADLFDTVEVNATFYRLPTVTAVARWAEVTPERFVFAVKVSRYLTHIRRLRDVTDGMARLAERLAPIADAGKLGPLLWQLPESFPRDDRVLVAALDDLPAGRHAFEFRHPSWFATPVLDALRERGVALVIGDTPERPAQIHALPADFTYVRLHYGRRGLRGNYSDAELQEWADRLTRWSAGHDVYAYFNNDWEGFAPRNATRLRALIGAGHGAGGGSDARFGPGASGTRAAQHSTERGNESL